MSSAIVKITIKAGESVQIGIDGFDAEITVAKDREDTLPCVIVSDDLGDEVHEIRIHENGGYELKRVT